MSVGTAMYTAISGLNTLGTAMSVIGNNIANVNTIGFKQARSQFQDLLSQAASTAGGIGQIGKGVALASVINVFSQGSFQNSTQDTDIAIAGEGFFSVRDPYSDLIYYTRAGNFIFDASGNMVNPEGYVLQGWALNDEGIRVGTPTDIKVTTFSSAPSPTSEVHFVTNLEASATSQSDPLDAFWDGSATNPISGGDYVYQTSIRVYDDLGEAHDLSIYFDPTDTPNKWEYIVCCDPGEDTRTDDGTATGTAYAGTQFAGLLMRGTITFDPNTGQIANTATAVTADYMTDNNAANVGAAGAWAGASTTAVTTSGTYTGNTAGNFTFSSPGAGGPWVIGTDAVDLSWTSPTGASGTVTIPATYTTGTAISVGEGVQVAFGAGQIVNSDSFTVPVTSNWTAVTPGTSGHHSFSASFLTDDAGTPISQSMDLNLGTKLSGGVWVNDNLSTTQYSATSTTVFQTQDGYSSGYLQRITVDTEGVVTGTYSNGQTKDLFQLSLGLFKSQWGLNKIGKNLFTQSRASGEPVHNPPGIGGTGTISPNSLEQSNVDLAEEFVKMIINQRGFQANSKIITTTDTMLAELINLKR